MTAASAGAARGHASPAPPIEVFAAARCGGGLVPRMSNRQLSESEGGEGRKARQQGGRGIEYNASAECAASSQRQSRLTASCASPLDCEQPAALG